MLTNKFTCCNKVCKRLISTSQSQQQLQLKPLTDTLNEEPYSQNVEDNPKDWDQSLPFSSLPGPKPLPIIGNVWRFFPGIGDFYGKSPEYIFNSMRQIYGDLFYLKGLPGVEPNVICFNPKDIEMVFRTEGKAPIRRFGRSISHYFNKFHKGAPVISFVGLQGEEWIKRRSMVNKIVMQPRVMKMHVPMMNEIADDLIDNIKYFANKDPKKEMPDNFQLELYKWTMESASIMAYNRRIGILAIKPNPEASAYINTLQDFFNLFYKLEVRPSLWQYYSTRSWKRFENTFRSLLNTNSNYIYESLSTFNTDPTIPEHEKSVLERLYKQNPIVAETMATSLLLGGIDSTGTAMAFILYHLSKNPEKQQILRDELKKHLPTKNSKITKEILNDSPYLKAVIKEALRIDPIAIGTTRTTIRNIVLSGYQIPKGTNIVVMNYLISQDEDNYIKSKQFVPERWLRKTTDEFSVKNVHPFVTLPFGFGQRSCVGKRFANIELEVGVAKVVRNFKISWNYPEVTIVNHLTRHIAQPLKFQMEELHE